MLRYRRWRVTGQSWNELELVSRSWGEQQWCWPVGTLDLHSDAASMHVSENAASCSKSAHSTSGVAVCWGWPASHSVPVSPVRFAPEFPMDSIATVADEATIWAVRAL